MSFDVCRLFGRGLRNEVPQAEQVERAKIYTGGQSYGRLSMRCVSGTFFFCLLLCTAGCGINAASETQIAGSEGALGRGTAAFDQKDYVTAEKELALAIQSGGLQADLAEMAIRTRARSLIELERFDEAELLLAELEQGAAELDQIWVIRCELALKQGNREAAKSALDEAKKLNPKIKPPAGL